MGGKIKPKALFELKKIHFICSILYWCDLFVPIHLSQKTKLI
jgi:hypothetical protein